MDPVLGIWIASRNFISGPANKRMLGARTKRLYKIVEGIGEGFGGRRDGWVLMYPVGHEEVGGGGWHLIDLRRKGNSQFRCSKRTGFTAFTPTVTAP